MPNDMIDSLHDQISHIDPAQRKTLVSEWLVPNPHKDDPSEVVIRGVWTSVWSIIGSLPAADADLELVARDYEIDLEAVVAAVVYYLEHQAMIDYRLLQNRSEPIQIN